MLEQVLSATQQESRTGLIPEKGSASGEMHGVCWVPHLAGQLDFLAAAACEGPAPASSAFPTAGLICNGLACCPLFRALRLCTPVLHCSQNTSSLPAELSAAGA